MFKAKSRLNSLEDLIYLGFLSSFFMLFQLGSGSLASWDEALYAEVAKQVIRTGNWFSFTWAGNPWVDKPALGIWATAFFYQLFGISEFSARFFSALSGIGIVIVTYLFGKELFGRWIGFLGACVLLSSSHFFRMARFGMLDAPLTFFLTLSLYFFWLGREKNRFLIFSGIALGLALMTKSFAAFFIFPVVWIYCFWSREVEILKRSTYWIGIMIAVAIALPWNLHELVAHKQPYLQEALVKHFFLRITQPLEGHTGNFYYYIRILVNKYHPWILVGIVSAPFFLFKAIKERVHEIIFVTCWMFSIFIILTLMQTKLAWYIFPVYPALSLSVGFVLSRLFPENYRRIVQGLFIIAMLLHIPYSHIFSQDYSRPLKAAAPLVQKTVPSDVIVYLFNYHESPGAHFYLERMNSYIDTKEDLAAEMKKQKVFYCLVLDRDLGSVDEFLSSNQLRVVGSIEGIHLMTKVKG